MSDLSGADIESRGNEPYRVITAVWNRLETVCAVEAPGSAKTEAQFSLFMAENYDRLAENGFSRAYINCLPVGELIDRMQDLVDAKAIHRS